YNILENDVIPTFYDRREGDTPDRWVEMMKNSMKLVLGNFCAHGMVRNYEKDYYLPAVRNYAALTDNHAKSARDLVARRKRLRREWPGVHIEPPESDIEVPFRVGDRFDVNTKVYLGALEPGEVEVELYSGSLKSVDELKNSQVTPMSVSEDLGGGFYRYTCKVVCQEAGRFGFTARVTPRGDDYLKNAPGFLTWA
ncbi:MAG: DUF3417 domain-containing protein, partial [Desulfosalsimonas sp.]